MKNSWKSGNLRHLHTLCLTHTCKYFAAPEASSAHSLTRRAIDGPATHKSGKRQTRQILSPPLPLSLCLTIPARTSTQAVHSLLPSSLFPSLPSICYSAVATRDPFSMLPRLLKSSQTRAARIDQRESSLLLSSSLTHASTLTHSLSRLSVAPHVPLSSAFRSVSLSHSLTYSFSASCNLCHVTCLMIAWILLSSLAWRQSVFQGRRAKTKVQ